MEDRIQAMRDVLNEALADACGQTALLLDQGLRVLYIRGDASPYLTRSSSDFSNNIIDLTDGPLKHTLQSMIHKANLDRSPVSSPVFTHAGPAGDRRLRLHARPATLAEEPESFTVVVFEHPPAPLSSQPPKDAPADDYRLALEESEERLQQIVSQLPFPAVVWGQDRRALMADQMFTDFFQIDGPMEGLEVDRFFGPLNVEDEVERAYSGEYCLVEELTAPPEMVNPQYRERNGELILELIIYPIFNLDGRVSHVVSLFRDVTRHKVAESQLMAYQRQLRAFALRLSTVQEEEKRRIAVELHDQIAQNLTLAKMKLEKLIMTCSMPESQRRSLKETCQLIQNGVEDTRTIILDLRPPVLYEMGLVEALLEMVEQVEETHALRGGLTHEDLPPLNEDLQSVVYRSVKELVMNVVRHAKARKYGIDLRLIEGALKVVVHDDGVGMEELEAPFLDKKSPAFGLFSIREEVESLGGDFTLSSRPGRGTQVDLRLPLPPGGSTS